MPDAMPPQDLRSEQVTLAACLFYPEFAHEITAMLAPGDFYRQEHAQVFEAISWAVERGWQPDAERVVGRLTQLGRFADGPITAPVYIEELRAAYEIGMKPLEYAEAVRQQSVRRSLIDAATQIRSVACDEEADLQTVGNRARAALQAALARDSSQATHTPIADAAGAWFDELEERIEAAEAGKPCLHEAVFPTRIANLDRMLVGGGIRRGKFVVIGARPSHGKTQLALQIASAAAMARRRVAMVSLEMGREELVSRIVSGHFSIAADDLDAEVPSRDTLRAIGAAVAEVSTWPLTIIEPDCGAVTASRIAAKCTELPEKPDLLVIDYLQLLDTCRDRNETDAHALGRTTRALKLMAVEQGMCVVLLSQLSRDVEKRQGRMPVLSDLRDSGSTEADADVVLLLMLPGQYLDSDAERPEAELANVIVAKQRNGPTGHVPHMEWSRRYVRYQCGGGREP